MDGRLRRQDQNVWSGLRRDMCEGASQHPPSERGAGNRSCIAAKSQELIQIKDRDHRGCSMEEVSAHAAPIAD
jgi:hypothetical protein